MSEDEHMILCNILRVLRNTENGSSKKAILPNTVFSCDIFSDLSGRVSKYTRGDGEEYKETLFYFANLGDCYERLKQKEFKMD